VRFYTAVLEHPAVSREFEKLLYELHNVIGMVRIMRCKATCQVVVVRLGIEPRTIGL
jgi:hypothetical protein